MNRSRPYRIATGFALLAVLNAPLALRASPQLAIDKGCYNCHGANLRGDAPSIDQLSTKLVKLKGDAAAQQRFVDKFRAGEMFEHVDTHERLSPESAKALIQWLAEGAK